MKKVKYIEQSGEFFLTHGKIYDASEYEDESSYIIRDDRGVRCTFYKHRFNIVNEQNEPTNEMFPIY